MKKYVGYIFILVFFAILIPSAVLAEREAAEAAGIETVQANSENENQGTVAPAAQTIGLVPMEVVTQAQKSQGAAQPQVQGANNNSDVTFTKIWNDNNVSSARPTTDVFKNNVKILVSSDNGKNYTDYSGSAPISNIKIENFNQWTFSASLPKGKTYSFREENLPSAYVVTNTAANTVTNTRTTNFSASIIWNDNSLSGSDANQSVYGTRPQMSASFASSNFVLKRYTEGKNPSPTDETINGANYTLTRDANNKWTVAFNNQPAYDNTGTPYIYYLTQNGNPSAKVDQGGYSALYTNVSNAAEKTDSLFNGGTLTNTLNMLTDVSFNKIWVDNGESAARPKVKLLLYRMADNEGTSSVLTSTGQFSKKGSPVQGHDSQDVPVEGAASSSLAISFTVGGTNSAKVPLYDAQGRRYVYYAVEYGSLGDYKQTINNTNTSASTALQTAAGSAGYIINNGTVTNKPSASGPISAAKLYQAESLQDLKGSVTLQLQKRIAEADAASSGETTWEDVTLPSGSASATLDFAEGESEKTGNVKDTDGSDASFPKYDETGKAIEYRFVETNITVGDKSTSVASYTTELRPNESNNVTLGNFGPGNGSSSTTVKMNITRDSSYTASPGGRVVNTLVGNTQIKITKKWQTYDASGSLVDLAAGSSTPASASFTITRSDGKTSGRDLQYTSGSPVGAISLSSTNGGSSSWTTTIAGLPRYDKNGAEYTYAVTENPISGWTSTRSMATTVAADASIQGSNDLVTQQEATITNTPGPGTALYFDVYKQWLDGSDLGHRHPVIAEVWRIKDANGSALASATLEATSESLNVGNGWHQQIEVQKKGSSDVVDNYVVVEKSINGNDGKSASVVYGSSTKAEIAKIANSASFTPDLFKNNAASASEALQHFKVGDVGTKDSDDGVQHLYNVYIKNNTSASTPSSSQTVASYTIYNQRHAGILIDLTKTWKTGKKQPDALFELSRNVKYTSASTPYGSFTVKSTALNGNANQTSATWIGGSSSSVWTTKEHDPSDTIIQKYANSGERYEYTLNEVGLSSGGASASFGADGAVVLGDERYVKSLGELKITIPESSSNAHTDGDRYSWQATNSLTDPYNITVNKVWRDDGTIENKYKTKNDKARPDITFDLYRTTASASEVLSAYSTNSDGSALTALSASPVNQLPVWNTKITGTSSTTVNDWFWTCNFGNVPRYDDSGNTYTYFLVESYPNGAGDYKVAYNNNSSSGVSLDNNGQDLYNGVFRPSASVVSPDSTQSVYTPNTASASFDTKVLIVSDGTIVTATPDATNPGGVKYQSNHYANTLVNYRAASRIIEGKKLWKLPNGITVASKDLPSVSVTLYKQNKASSSSADVPTQTTVLNGNKQGNWSFKFPVDNNGQSSSLSKYDEYGQMEHYFVKEETNLSSYSASQSVGNDFTITNTYVVKQGEPSVSITLNKNWFSASSASPATAKFELWAKYPSATLMSGKETDFKLAEGSLSSNLESGVSKLVFNRWTTNSIDPNSPLPYYSPISVDGTKVPLTYYIKEKLPGGYTATVTTGDLSASTNNAWESTLSSPSIKLTESSGTYSGSASFTNTYNNNNSRRNYKVIKNWEDSGNQFASRPDSIAIELWREYKGSATKIVDSQLSSSTGWSASFTNLIAFSPDGTKYGYYIKEPNVPVNYNSQGSASSHDNTSIKLTNTLKTVSVSASKTWTNSAGDDIGGSLGTEKALPTKISFELIKGSRSAGSSSSPVNWERNHYKLNSQALSSSAAVNQTTGKLTNEILWDNLPRYSNDGSTEYYYKAVETGVWYDNKFTPLASAVASSSSTWGSASTADKAVNTTAYTNQVATASISATKTWVDNDNRDGKRPNSIKLQLMRDGTSAGSPVIVSYNHEWQNLPIYKNGSSSEKSVYQVIETGVTGYSASYAAQSASLSASETKVINITNTHAPKLFSASVIKNWQDSSSHVQRPDSISFTLQATTDSSNPIWTSATKVDASAVSQLKNSSSSSSIFTTSEVTQTFTKSGNEITANPVWDNLPGYAGGKLIYYRIVETVTGANTSWTTLPIAPFYYTEQNGKAVNPKITVTNKLSSSTSLTVTKRWSNQEVVNKNNLMPESVTVQLQQSVDNGTNWTDVANGSAKLSASGNWNATFTNLEGNYKYRVIEKTVQYNSGNPISIENSCFSTSLKTTYDSNLKNYSSSITNALDTTTVTANKVWNDYNNAYHTRPANLTSINVQLYQKAVGADWQPYQIDGVNQSASIPKNLSTGEWGSASFTNLPKKDKNGQVYLYEVQETTQVEGYTKSESTKQNDDGTFTATMTNTTTFVPNQSITFTKVWNDNRDAKGLRPDDLTFTVYNNGVEIPSSSLVFSKTVLLNNSWQITVNGLPGTGNFTIKEHVPEGYRVDLEQPALTNGLRITNSLKSTKDFFFTKLGTNDELDLTAAAPTAGAEFGLYKLADASDSAIKTAVSDAAGVVSFGDIAEGTFYVKEIQAPAAFKADNTVYKITVDKDGKVTTNFTAVKNEAIRGSIVITKVDESNQDKLLPGSTYSLYKKVTNNLTLGMVGVSQNTAEEKIMDGVTDANGQVRFSNLLIGPEYVVRETAAPPGYQVSAKPLELDFTLSENGEEAVVHITSTGDGTIHQDENGNIIWNEPPAVVAINKTNEAGTPLAGAGLKLTDAEGNVVDEWVSDGTARTFSGTLHVNDTYTLTETSAPAGYTIAAPVQFKVIERATGPNEQYVQNVTMVNKAVSTPTDPTTPTNPTDPANPSQPSNPAVPGTTDNTGSTKTNGSPATGLRDNTALHIVLTVSALAFVFAAALYINTHKKRGDAGKIDAPKDRYK